MRNIRHLASIALFLTVSLVASYGAEEAEDANYPWSVSLRSFYDRKGSDNSGDGLPWLLNLGPTGIRARIYPDRPNLLVVKYVFEDAKSPAHGKIKIDDAIAGANGKLFQTKEYHFRKRGLPRNLVSSSGWEGPMLELAPHIEDSQAKDGILTLIVWPKGDQSKQCDVKIQLRTVGRFSPTYPFNCTRSDKLLEELCDFLVMDYQSDNWKKKNTFGEKHSHAHGLLALMASGIPKYEPLIAKEISNYYDNTYDPLDGGFAMWKWGFDSVVMGEAYRLYKDTKLKPAMESLAKAMPHGSAHSNGIYTHRSYLNIKGGGGKPYASIAAISGLNMIGMSLFKANGLPHDKTLHETIHQLYLASAAPDTENIAYCFNNSNTQGVGSNGRDQRHAYVKMKDPSKGLSGKGPGHLCPTGMNGISPSDYEIVWPTKEDPRYKPTDWVALEANENLVEEEKGEFRTFIRYTGAVRYPEPTQPYNTTRSGNHLAPIGMGALAHLIGNKDSKSWNFLGQHCANTCVLGPGSAFDGHASSNLAAFWSILGAAHSDRPDKVRAYLDYMKNFLILSECHNGGLYLQPWGRDRVDTDATYGPRTLPTMTGAILLSLSKKRLLITGAGDGSENANATPKADSLKSAFATVATAKPAAIAEANPKAVTVSETTRLERLGLLRQKIVASAKSGKPLKGMVNVNGKTELYTLQSADEKNLNVDINGASMPVSWKWLKPKDFVALSKSLAKDDDAESLVTWGVFLMANGEVDAAETVFARAKLLDASSVQNLDAREKAEQDQSRK